MLIHTTECDYSICVRIGYESVGLSAARVCAQASGAASCVRLNVINDEPDSLRSECNS